MGQFKDNGNFFMDTEINAPKPPLHTIYGSPILTKTQAICYFLVGLSIVVFMVVRVIYVAKCQ